MNNEIELFKNEELGEVRFIVIDNKEYAVGIDIAKLLGYQKPSNAIMKHCKHGIKKVIEADTQKGDVVKTETTLIDEGDIYRLIITASKQSKNPEIKVKAEKFECWVMDEVLPSIRKHGMYITEELLKNKSKLNEQLSILQNEYYELESKNISLNFENKTLKDKKEELQKENCKLRTERHMPSVVCLKAKTDESYLPDLALQLIRLYLKEHSNIITRKLKEGIYIKKRPIEKELKKITFTSKERTLLILSIGNIIESTNEIFIKNEYLADDFYLKSTLFLNN